MAHPAFENFEFSVLDAYKQAAFISSLNVAANGLFHQNAQLVLWSDWKKETLTCTNPETLPKPVCTNIQEQMDEMFGVDRNLFFQDGFVRFRFDPLHPWLDAAQKGMFHFGTNDFV